MQAADWIGGVGRTWSDEWRRTDRSFAGLDPALEAAILAMAPTGSARLVDVGCGAGSTSLAVAAARPAAEVIGLDLSPDLVEVADVRRREHGFSQKRCRFVAGDAPAGVGELAPVDLFLSRHGVMFFADPVAAFTRLAAAAMPGGRLVFSCFADIADNPWATETVGGLASTPPERPEPGPFAFADRARVSAILAAAGWEATGLPERVTFRYVAGGGEDPVADAIGFFGRIGPAARALKDADGEDARASLLDRIARACERHRDGGEVAFPATAWLWSARAKESPR